MDKAQFVYITYIATTPERLWEALTQGEFTQHYWYGRRVESDWQIGSPVRFYDGDTDTVTDDGVVLESAPPQRLSYTFHPNWPDMPTTRVSINIEAMANQVKLTLIHDEIPEGQLFEDFRQGWSRILSSLKTYLETGKALPEREEEKEKAEKAQ